MANALTLQSLPLFPLGTVLFPEGLLPLRVFEVRYLDMISRCRRTGAPFGVVSLTQGHEVRQPGAALEAFSSVGTLASIADFEQPQPGLMLIRVQGQQRFRIRSSEQLRHGLWVADVERVEPDHSVPIPDDLKGTATALSKVIQAIGERQQPGAPLPMPQPHRMEDCGWVANRWCELLPLPVEVKQRLMSLDNPLLRLELVADILTRNGIAGA